MFMCKSRFIILLLSLPKFCFCLMEGKIGTVDFSTILSTTYDSNLFSLTKSEINSLESSGKIESSDDFSIRFSPVLHYSKQLSLLRFGASAGIDVTEFIYNKERSYIIPVTSIILDFDETLSKKKSFSNNAKIRFSATFDVGQNIGSDLLEGDLISYTYFNAGFEVRYNHSPKFGIGTGTNYGIREYQSGSINSDYDDFETFPISTSAYYIYSPKLDFYGRHTLQRTKSSSGSANLSNFKSNTYSLGANGIFSQKLSGQIEFGITSLDYKRNDINNDSSITSTISLNLVHNEKTTSSMYLNRSFSPTASGFVQLATTLGYDVTHRINDRLNGNVGASIAQSEITMDNSSVLSVKQYSLNAGISRRISNKFTGDLTYRFSHVNRLENFNKHTLTATLNGNF